MRNLVFALLGALLLSLNVATATACSCAPPPEPKIALEKADAVFSGKVVSAEEKGFQKEVVFQVKSVWKGTLATTTTIFTGSQSAMCGFGFEPDHEYLVYASKNGGEVLQTSLCTRTKAIEKAKEDLTALGDPIETKATTENTTGEEKEEAK